MSTVLVRQIWLFFLGPNTFPAKPRKTVKFCLVSSKIQRVCLFLL